MKTRVFAPSGSTISTGNGKLRPGSMASAEFRVARCSGRSPISMSLSAVPARASDDGNRTSAPPSPHRRAERTVLPKEPGGQEVHLRRPDDAGDEVVDRLAVDLLGRLRLYGRVIEHRQHRSVDSRSAGLHD